MDRLSHLLLFRLFLPSTSSPSTDSLISSSSVYSYLPLPLHRPTLSSPPLPSIPTFHLLSMDRLSHLLLFRLFLPSTSSPWTDSLISSSSVYSYLPLPLHRPTLSSPPLPSIPTFHLLSMDRLSHLLLFRLFLPSTSSPWTDSLISSSSVYSYLPLPLHRPTLSSPPLPSIPTFHFLSIDRLSHLLLFRLFLPSTSSPWTDSLISSSSVYSYLPPPLHGPTLSSPPLPSIPTFHFLSFDRLSHLLLFRLFLPSTSSPWTDSLISSSSVYSYLPPPLHRPTLSSPPLPSIPTFHLLFMDRLSHLLLFRLF